MSLTRQWWKNRWTQIRWGMGNYLSMVVSFTTLILILTADYHFSIVEDVATFVGLTSLAAALGYFHLKVQQDTDALLTNQAVIDEIVRRVKD